MKTVLTLVAFSALLVMAALGFIYSGTYDVSAASPDAGLIHWALDTTRSRSVHRAMESLEGKVQVPPLDDPERIRTGLYHYHEMCATCHGAPGVQISSIGQGLNPYPPELVDEAGHEGPEELFWVTKNGIKMTGMPSFGVTHSDDEIWAIVAFMKKMPSLTPAQYEAMVREAGLGEEGSSDTLPAHGAGQPRPDAGQ